MSRPIVAVTLGDASGIGPEVVARVASQPTSRETCRLVAIGDPHVLRRNVERYGLPLQAAAIDKLSEARYPAGVLEVIEPANAQVDEIQWGQVDEHAGRSSLAAFELAARLASHGDIDALLSAPVSKEALHLGGMRHPDELALLAELTHSKEPLLIGVLPDLLTVCVTLHVPIREVPALVKRARVVETATVLVDVLSRREPHPVIAIAGLNPHAGEGGLLGREEIDEIVPAVEELRAHGIGAIGPVAPDSLFPFARARGAHGVVCMYHDQANIARKLAGYRGASLFVGLPVPIGTTAHGTAFDRAGQGTADTTSLALALDHLVRLASPSDR